MPYLDKTRLFYIVYTDNRILREAILFSNSTNHITLFNSIGMIRQCRIFNIRLFKIFRYLKRNFFRIQRHRRQLNTALCRWIDNHGLFFI